MRFFKRMLFASFVMLAVVGYEWMRERVGGLTTAAEKPAETIVPLDPAAAEPQGGVVVARSGAEKAVKRIEGVAGQVHDGDTLWVTDDKGERFKIRLNGIDAPESDQKGGKASGDYLRRLVDGQRVVVKYESRDKYGRCLGTVYLPMKDGSLSDVNLIMLKRGWAWHYTRFDSQSAYAQAEAEARAAKRGIWESGDAIQPERWRHRGDPVPTAAVPRNEVRSEPRAVPQKTGPVPTGDEYFAGRDPNVRARPACPVTDRFPDTGYWLSTNSMKRHNRNCENYRKTRGRPCSSSEGTPCKKCGG